MKVIAGNTYQTFRAIWRTRIVRRMISVLVRSPLRSSTLRLVNFDIPLPPQSGCVIIICHSPWRRLLVQWCRENDFALIISSGKWKPERGGKLQRTGKGFSELRSIINYLKQAGRLVMTADNFNNLDNCPVEFLGSHLNAGLLPTRFARIAQTPLIVAIPVFKNGRINFTRMPPLDWQLLQPDPCSAIQHFLFTLENEMKENPVVSNFYDR